MALRIGFAQEIITPELGVPLCGYFVPRPNTGAYDDLYVRALVIEGNDGERCAIVSADLCFLSLELIDRCRCAIKNIGIDYHGKIIFSATHTHTAPYPAEFFGDPADETYLAHFAMKCALAIKRADAGLAGCTLATANAYCDTLAFNRRYWMKDGTVITNPPKLDPEIVKPEGPVDYDIPVAAFMQGGKIAALLVNIVNHTDTVDGDVVSADWPGRMTRAIQNKLGFDVPVITLIGASGNINHFNPADAAQTSSFAEATRIGNGYADAVTAVLKDLKTVAADDVKFVSSVIEIPYCEITDEDAARAQAILDKPFDGENGDMTARGLARGEGAVARFFAGQLLDYQKNCSGKSRKFRLVSMQFGNDIAISTLPGEPFTEIGMAIKKASRFPMTMIASLTMGECGYIPMPECFDRGGYEILPVDGGAPAHDTAIRLIEEASALVK